MKMNSSFQDDISETSNKTSTQTLTLRRRAPKQRYLDAERKLQDELQVEPERGRIQNIEDDEYEEDAYISIGIDLGTTYSGVAWALSTNPKEIEIISNWESDLPTSSDLHKVPSVLTYNSRGEVCSWGYNIDPRRHSISWFKLGLSEHGYQRLQEDQPERYERLQALFKAFDKEPVDVAADYLRCLWSHATERIEKRVGKHLWESLTLKIVLTVPAIWDHKAQELTRKAADMAGLRARSDTVLELIAEPEAAALAVFDEMGANRKRGLQVGDSFVVCDAGGGTVDLISYTIEQLKPLKLAMCSESTGGLCGAIFLDGAFEKQIRTIIGAEEYNNLKDSSKRRMMNNWETGIKRGFRIDAPEHRKWYVDIPGYLGVPTSSVMSEEDFPAGFTSPTGHISPSERLSPRPLSQLRLSGSFLSSDSLRSDPGSLVLKTGHLNAIFSEVCSKIKDLVADQLTVVAERAGKEAVAILLVGGFGENTYLRQELERSFSHVETQQPTKAWAAICRGAVLKGLGNNLVVNHIAKYNYGVLFTKDFDEKIHLQIDRTFDAIRRVWIAGNQVQWFLRRGENVEKTDPVRYGFFWPISSKSRENTFTATIYYSDSLIAENRIEPTVKLLCKLEMTFDPSVYDELPSKINDNGEEWRQLDCIIEMQVSSGELCWSAKYKGIEAGAVKTIVGYEGATAIQ